MANFVHAWEAADVDALVALHGTGLFVITLAGDRICGMIRFENSMFPAFGLPRSREGAKS
ncbi:hypothetical protein [Amycolatopsis sp. NPDC051371]|uniref:hypothetical protein n=1 Tax=Amycolatopsis sp. NPDC051371 TaxID=3155800 RepID=UPI003446D341